MAPIVSSRFDITSMPSSPSQQYKYTLQASVWANLVKSSTTGGSRTMRLPGTNVNKLPTICGFKQNFLKKGKQYFPQVHQWPLQTNSALNFFFTLCPFICNPSLQLSSLQSYLLWAFEPNTIVTVLLLLRLKWRNSAGHWLISAITRVQEKLPAAIWLIVYTVSQWRAVISTPSEMKPSPAIRTSLVHFGISVSALHFLPQGKRYGTLPPTEVSKNWLCWTGEHVWGQEHARGGGRPQLYEYGFSRWWAHTISPVIREYVLVRSRKQVSSVASYSGGECTSFPPASALISLQDHGTCAQA